MADFQMLVIGLLSPAAWRVIELCEFCIIPAGFMWQLVYDPRYDIDGTLTVSLRRVGLIIQIVFALAGIGDAFNSREPNILFIGYASGTLLIHMTLMFHWVLHRRAIPVH